MAQRWSAGSCHARGFHIDFPKVVVQGNPQVIPLLKGEDFSAADPFGPGSAFLLF